MFGAKLAALCCAVLHPSAIGDRYKNLPLPQHFSPPPDGRDGNSCQREETRRKTLKQNQTFILDKATSCTTQFLELTTVQEGGFKACNGSDPEAAKAKKKKGFVLFKTAQAN